MRRIAATAVMAGLAFAGLSSPVSAATSEDTYCGVECQWELQRSNALPRGSFYQAPVPLPSAKAGTLIRSQFTDEYVAEGRRIGATRLLYHSRTSAGKDIAASGVVLVPQGRPPVGGWPVVVNAHGASGVGTPCAPSLMRDLYHGDQMMKFVRAGFAVVAPDYAGLGTDGRHELGNKVAGSNDVLHAISAARTAVPQLSRRWVLWGHSQGGGIGLAVGEVQRSRLVPGYLGAVITAPAANLPAIAERVATTPGFGGFVPLLIAGARHGDPKVDPAKLLAAEAFAVGKGLGLTKTGCLGVVTAAYAHLSGEQLVSPAYWVDPRFAKFLENNTVGRRPIGGPVLLLQGTSDAVIPRGETDDIARRLCAVGTRLDYRVYPGLDHDTTPWSTGIDDGAMPDILQWVTDRFAGKPARTTC